MDGWHLETHPSSSPNYAFHGMGRQECKLELSVLRSITQSKRLRNIKMLKFHSVMRNFYLSRSDMLTNLSWFHVIFLVHLLQHPKCFKKQNYGSVLQTLMHGSDFWTPALVKVGCIFLIGSTELANMNDKLCWERETPLIVLSLTLYWGDSKCTASCMLNISFEINLQHPNIHTLLTLKIICSQYHKIQSSDHVLRM